MTKDQVEQKASIAKQRVKVAAKATENTMEALKRAMEENSKIRANQEALAVEIKKLRASLEKSEAKAR